MSKAYRANMRIAVAGTCGLALILAREIHDETSHQLIILSRSVRVKCLLKMELRSANLAQYQPGLISQGYQCQVSPLLHLFCRQSLIKARWLTTATPLLSNTH
jgi:hypothetical protein